MEYTIDYLKSYDIEVILVFDRARNPTKSEEDAARRNKIEEHRAETG